MKFKDSRTFSPDAVTGGKEPPLGGIPGKAATLPNGSEGKGGNGGDIWGGLVKDPDNLEYVKTKGWSDPEETIKSYRELESKSSNKEFKLPEKDAKPEELDQFYNQLGRPEKPEGYDFKLDDKIPDSFPYEEKTASEFKSIAHEARLTADQAQKLHDWYVGSSAGAFQESLKSTADKVTKAHEEIVKNFGDPEGEKYKRHMELADRAVREISDPKDRGALRQELIDMGAILPDGKVMAPKLILALSRVGESLFSEDKVYSGVSSGKNPFKAETENLTLQGKFLKDDPDMARQLILAANLDPKEFGLK